MAIIQGVLAMVTRSAGKVLNTAFGWATIMLFGKVSQDRQIYLSTITFGSLVWIIVVAGIAAPELGVFLLSFVNLPEWINENWVRLAMLAAAALVPLVIGALS